MKDCPTRDHLGHQEVDGLVGLLSSCTVIYQNTGTPTTPTPTPPITTEVNIRTDIMLLLLLYS